MKSRNSFSPLIKDKVKIVSTKRLTNEQLQIFNEDEAVALTDFIQVTFK